MLVITGWGSAIVQALLPTLPVEEVPERADCYDVRFDAERYLFCAGVLRSKPIAEQTQVEIAETFMVNCGAVIQACDAILAVNDKARICVIGSESGFAWSHDGAYAASKAALHRYVETKRLRTKDQQLVGIAPSIIEDAGMTIRRSDQANLDRRRDTHPKRRFLQASEVARLIRFCLYEDFGYLSGIVIRMHGGGV